MIREISIIYYIEMYKRSWKAMVTTVCVVMFLVFVILILRPNNYVSSVTILHAGASPSASSTIARLLSMPTDLTSSKDIIVSILKSKRMARDIQEYFKVSEMPNFWWKISTRDMEGGFAIDVIGPDPALTEKIANFCVENLDKINTELDITPSKPMVKVLDAATLGSPESKQIPQKMFAAGIIAFLLHSLYVFFADHIRKLKIS